jgi:hypothetical protein
MDNAGKRRRWRQIGLWASGPLVLRCLQLVVDVVGLHDGSSACQTALAAVSALTPTWPWSSTAASQPGGKSLPKRIWMRGSVQLLVSRVRASVSSPLRVGGGRGEGAAPGLLGAQVHEEDLAFWRAGLDPAFRQWLGHGVVRM